jgi:two-component sensor histidine kinase
MRLVFQDDGKGFPSGFDWHATESLGLRLVRMLSEQLRPDLRHRNGSGTTFKICFDIHGAETADSRER